ncbi:sterol esterase [Ranunculus cassubicifolius]
MIEISLLYGSSDGFCALAVPASLHGYTCQEFAVTTQDGYILSMQRVGGGSDDGGRSKQPVLLQHGVLVDGLTWFLNSPDQDLPFILVDNGFDVWIANFRGTTFSRKHTTLDSSKSEYWNWSWDEIAEYDFPATVNFVYQQTGTKIKYVGHSMGTLVAMTTLSQGKMLDKLESAALLCPIAYLNHMRTPLGLVAVHTFTVEITMLLGVPEFNPNTTGLLNIFDMLCANFGINCYELLTPFTGKNCCLNASTVELALKHEPQPTSTKNAVHFAQTARNTVLSKYDYGRHNMEYYGQTTPPVYNLSAIPKNFPLFISHGGQDALSDVEDVSTLLDVLKSHDGDKLKVQFVKDYGHCDFIIGVTAKDIVYPPLIAFLQGK